MATISKGGIWSILYLLFSYANSAPGTLKVVQDQSEDAPRVSLDYSLFDQVSKLVNLLDTLVQLLRDFAESGPGFSNGGGHPITNNYFINMDSPESDRYPPTDFLSIRRKIRQIMNLRRGENEGYHAAPPLDPYGVRSNLQGDENSNPTPYEIFLPESQIIQRVDPSMGPPFPNIKATKRPFFSPGFSSHKTDHRQHFFSVWKSEMQKFPFSNMVYLSSKCSGILLSPSFVLTMASCVQRKKSKLEVYRASRDGARVARHASDVYIPKQFTSGSKEQKAENDYAILKLDEPITNVPYARLAIMGSKYLTTMQKPYEFVGYYETYSEGMSLLHSECMGWSVKPSGTVSMSLPGCLILHGMEGGPAYVLPAANEDYRIFGMMKKGSGMLLLNKDIVKDICLKTVEMGEERNCKGV